MRIKTKEEATAVGSKVNQPHSRGAEGTEKDKKEEMKRKRDALPWSIYEKFERTKPPGSEEDLTWLAASKHTREWFMEKDIPGLDLSDIDLGRGDAPHCVDSDVESDNKDIMWGIFTCRAVPREEGDAS